MGARRIRPRFVSRPLVTAVAVAVLATSCEGPTDEDTEIIAGEATVPTNFADSAVASVGSPATTMAFAPDGRLFVAQQNGRLRVIKNGSLLSTPFLTLTVDGTYERGLLGVAFDPNWSSEKWVYVYYTVPGSPPHNRVRRYKVSANNPDVADTATGDTLIDLPNLNAVYHNGGALNFGADGKLYIAVGDNKNGTAAQSKSSVLGKILRLNKDGSIPTDNPFYTTTSGNNRAIWALGLRNPFTFAVQPGTSRMFINDVGEATYEEINDGVKGANYGWPNTEGPTGNASYRSPFYYYGSRSTSPSGRTNCSIIGAAFYNPTTVKFPADYLGDYFFADYCGYSIRRIDPSTKSVSNFANGVTSPVDLRVGSDGALYYLMRSGAVRKISYTGTTNLPPFITDHPDSKTVAPGQSVTFTVAAGGTAPLTYQWQRNGSNITGATSTSYTRTAQTTDNGTTYRCVVKNAYGTATSNSATLTVTSNKPPVAKITAPLVGTLYKGGQTVSYAGTGTDPENGTLPGSAFTWQVDFHHDTHTHPFIPATTGSTSGSFVVPTTNETAANVWYRIHLTVKDNGGLTNSTYVDVKPVTQSFTVASNPAGLQLTLDGQPFVAPKTLLGVVGIKRTLGVVSPQTLNGKTYELVSWSDGGTATHTISTPATATTYTATFKVSTTRIYEAENAVRVGAVVASTHPGYTGTGYVDYVATSGEYIEWTVNAPTSGTYTLTFRYANGGTASRPLAITRNGTTVSASFAFPVTGAWTTWATVNLTTTLNAGSNKVRATSIGSSGPNVDHLRGP